MAVNPVGAVRIFDGGMPKFISARNPTGVTGGQLVFFAGGSDVVSSGLNSFGATDIIISGLASGLSFNGIVITAGNTASGTNSYVAIGLDGLYILPCAGAIDGGKATAANGGDAVINLGSFAVPVSADDSAAAGRKIGRNITSGFSGTTQFAIIQLTP